MYFYRITGEYQMKKKKKLFHKCEIVYLLLRCEEYSAIRMRRRLYDIGNTALPMRYGECGCRCAAKNELSHY